MSDPAADVSVSIINPNGTLRPLADIKMDALLKAIVHCGGNKSAAYRGLKMGRGTIYRMLGKLKGDKTNG